MVSVQKLFDEEQEWKWACACNNQCNIGVAPVLHKDTLTFGGASNRTTDLPISSATSWVTAMLVLWTKQAYGII